MVYRNKEGYANINELSETWLDVLAYDLHVDWYQYKRYHTDNR